MLAQRGEVLLIPGFIGEADVQGGRYFVEGIVFGAVHGEREHRIVARKDRSVAVALVDIQVDDERAANPHRPHQHPYGDGYIVQHTEAFAVPGEGMVGAPGEVAGQAIFQRHHRRIQCALDGQTGAFYQLLGPGKAHFAHFLFGEGAVSEAGDVVFGVNEEEITPVGFAWRHNIGWGDDIFAQELPAEGREFAHREGVPFGERDVVAFAVTDSHPGWNR